MKLTSNYNLKKPDGSDVVNVQDFNDNSDKIDLELKKVDSSLKEIKNNLGDSVKKDGSLQTNLNADLLDGKHANDFAASNHDHNVINGNNSCGLKLSSAGTNDCSGTSKTNNVDIASWYGVSFSNSCSGSGIQGKPSASIDVRNGNMFLDGDVYLKGQNTGLFQSVSNGKSAIANAITGKGVGASNNETFQQLANKINQISSGKKYTSGYLNVGKNNSTTINLGFVPTAIVGSGERPNMMMIYLKDSYSSIRNTTEGELAGKIYASGTIVEIQMKNSNSLKNFLWYAFE
ncbi:hypothetical protein DVW05_04245 [Clostridium botulinum]|uniref:hypothetical protein n=1 Tax=unclassified Clostridium TaxID=2614128 RepID=UPI0002DE54F4|nr:MULTISPECIES: hypothetical protein [unclassified Clostridium]MBN1054557.1 hypothetical protein [Clostridium botulinum]